MSSVVKSLEVMFGKLTRLIDLTEDTFIFMTDIAITLKTGTSGYKTWLLNMGETNSLH